MRKYLSLALISLLFPIASGIANPIPGHYYGTGIDGPDLVLKEVSFDLSKKGYIHNLHIGTHHVRGQWELHGGKTFHFDDRSAAAGYAGHGKWEGSLQCEGDFRHYFFGGDKVNIYFTWNALWEHK